MRYRIKTQLALLWQFVMAVVLISSLIPASAGAQALAGFAPLDIDSADLPRGPGSDAAEQPAAAAQLAYSTYLGGASSDIARAVALDTQGNIYVAGDTASPSFLGITIPNAGGTDVIVLKFSPDGRSLLAGAVLGSSSDDIPLDMAVTPQGEVVLTVYPGAPNFPLKRAILSQQPYGNRGMLLKLNAAFNDLVFSTHLGFELAADTKQGLALDSQGNIYVTGDRYDASTVARDLIVQKYRPDGQQIMLEKVWNNDRVTEVGTALALGPDGAIHITGEVESYNSEFAVTADALQPVCGGERGGETGRSCGKDAFIVILEPNGHVRYASYLGGSASDSGAAIDVDPQGNLYVLGTTSSTDFVTSSGALQPRCEVEPATSACYYDLFVIKLAADGRSIRYSSYLNSADRASKDLPAALRVNAAGHATIVGYTNGELFPVAAPVQSALAAAPCLSTWENRMCFDLFAVTLDANGAQTFGTYLGARFDERTYDVALAANGSMVIVGEATGPGFPVTPDAIQSTLRARSDMYLTRINAGSSAPPPTDRPFHVFLPLMRR